MVRNFCFGVDDIVVDKVIVWGCYFFMFGGIVVFMYIVVLFLLCEIFNIFFEVEDGEGVYVV